jgi:hypothetical protein
VFIDGMHLWKARWVVELETSGSKKYTQTLMEKNQPDAFE